MIKTTVACFIFQLETATEMMYAMVLLLLQFIIAAHVLSAAAECPDGWTNSAGFCYNYTSLTLPFDQARSYCTQNGGRMVVEVSAVEHSAFQAFRDSLPDQGNSVWTGITVEVQGQWKFLADPGFKNVQGPIYQHWNGGSMPPANLGQCAISDDYSGAQFWASVSCNESHAIICEATPINAPAGGTGGGAISTVSLTPSNSTFRHWVKEFPNAKFTLSSYVIPIVMTHTHTVTSCAIMCSSVMECLAFNHYPANQTCQYIVTNVNETDVAMAPGWDVWVENMFA